VSSEHVFKTVLPLVVSNGFLADRWRVSDASWKPVAEVIAGIIKNPARLPDDAYYKNELRRLIFRLEVPDGKPDVVVKGFPLKKWKYKIRYKQYAYNEALNLIVAKQRGLPVPDVFGLGCGFRRGLLSWVAVIMEHVPFPCMRDNFIRGLSDAEALENLRRTIPSFRKLYLAGCNHIDFGPHSIMLAPDSAAKDVLIDFQYAGFVNAPDQNILAAQLGYFGWAVGTNRAWVSPTMRDQWYSEVLCALDIPFTKRLQGIIRQNEACRRSSKERLSGI
jgi:hypothetical protein